jgi:hypothetical protein
MTLTVYHPGIAVPPSFELFDNTAGSQVTIVKGEQKMTLMQEDVVTMEVESVKMLPFQLGDYIEVFEKTYKINKFPECTKTANKKFRYTVIFEGLQYNLINTAFLLGKDTMLDSLTADIDTFLALIITNLNRVYPSLWAAGSTPISSSVKNLTFGSESNCLEALQKVCEEYSQEFDITTVSGVNYINIRKREVYFTSPFSIGKSGGLYSIKRTLSDTYPFITRLFVFGSNENLGNAYRHTRLCLPSKNKDNSYLETSILGQPVIEGTKIYEDIKPEREGTITGIDGAFSFYDSSMDFDLKAIWQKRNVMWWDGTQFVNDYTVWLTRRGLTDSSANQTIYDDSVYTNTKYLLNGENAKVHFQTGQLAGYDLEIIDYDHSTKKFTIKQFADENGNLFPHEKNAAFQFDTGDKYILLDIALPETYITAAETALQTKAAEYFAITEKPLFQYEIDISPLKIKLLRAAAGGAINLFTIGDYAKIVDSDFAVNDYYRIIEYVRNIININDIKIVLSDEKKVNLWEKMFEAQKESKRVIEVNKLNLINRTVQNFKTTMEVYSNVFNSLKLIDGEKIEIKPQAEASINNELYYDNTNTVKIYKVPVTIQTDKESDEIMVGEQSVVTAYISPNVAKQNEIDVSVTANLSIISITESYDSSLNLVFTVTVQGNAEGNEEITLTSATDSSITKNIAIKVNPLPTILIDCPDENDINVNEPFDFIAYLDPNDYPNIGDPDIEGDIELLGFSAYSELGLMKYNVSIKGTVSASSGAIILTSNKYPTVQKTITFNII